MLKQDETRLRFHAIVTCSGVLHPVGGPKLIPCGNAPIRCCFRRALVHSVAQLTKQADQPNGNGGDADDDAEGGSRRVRGVTARDHPDNSNACDSEGNEISEDRVIHGLGSSAFVSPRP